MIKALKNRWIDLAFLDSAWYVREWDSVAPLLQAEIEGKRNYNLLLLVHKNSLLYRLTDFPPITLLLRQQQKDMAGYYAPLGFLEKHNVSPVQKLHYLETYDSILKGVAYGKGEEVGCIPEYVWNQQLNNRILEFVRIVEVLPAVPTPVLVSRRGEEAKYTSLKKALVSLPGSVEGIRIFEQTMYSGFTEEMKERAGVMVRTLAELSKEPLLSFQIGRIDHQVQSLRMEKDVVWARVVDRNFRVLSDTREEEEGWVLTDPIPESLELDIQGMLLYARSPIVIMGSPEGWAEIVFALKTLQEKIAQNRKIFLAILGFSYLWER